MFDNRRTLFFIFFVLVLFIAGGLFLERNSSFAPLKQTLRSHSVPTAMLNYGELGKILKHHGLVSRVPNDFKRFPKSKEKEPDLNASIFRKKRHVGAYLFKANPHGYNDIPSSRIIKKEDFKEGWPLISVTVPGKSLYNPTGGIVANYDKRGRQWERPAYVSYFEKGELLFATAAGIRLHGGYSRLPRGKMKKQKHSYRLYFRNEYGANQFLPSIMPDAAGFPIKRLIIHKIEPFLLSFTPCIAFDIARRIGCIVPQTRLTQFYLNGRPHGYYYLSEHVGRRQYRERLGHDNFLFYRYMGQSDDESVSAYVKLRKWARNPGIQMNLEEAQKYVDIDNMSRQIFSWMFCGTTDQLQGSAILDRSKPAAKWYWINWDMDQSFIDFSKNKRKRRPPWKKEGIELGLCERNHWLNAGDVRQILFTRLMDESPEYKEYFFKLAVDLLENYIDDDFLNERLDYYAGLTIPNGTDRSPAATARRVKGNIGRLKQFMKLRPGFIMKQLNNYRKYGRRVQVRVNGAPGNSYEINGRTIKGNYRAWYFNGQQIKIKFLKEDYDSFSHWQVNKKKITGREAVYTVNSETVISAVLKKEDLLMTAARNGELTKAKAIIKNEIGKNVSSLSTTVLTRALEVPDIKAVPLLRKAGAELDTAKVPDNVLKNYIKTEFKAPLYKEHNVFNPSGGNVTEISPPLITFSKWGEYKIEAVEKNKFKALEVSNISPGKQGRRRLNLGFEAGKKEFDLDIPKSGYVHFIVEVNVPEGLLDKYNFIFISDFVKDWETANCTFSRQGRNTYLVSKKIRRNSRRIIIGFRYSPKTAEDKLIIENMKIFAVAPGKDTKK